MVLVVQVFPRYQVPVHLVIALMQYHEAKLGIGHGINERPTISLVTPVGTRSWYVIADSLVAHHEYTSQGHVPWVSSNIYHCFGDPLLGGQLLVQC